MKENVAKIVNELVDYLKTRIKNEQNDTFDVEFYIEYCRRDDKKGFMLGSSFNSNLTPMLSEYDFRNMIAILISQINKMKHIRGFGDIAILTEEVNISEGWRSNYFKFPKRVVLLSKPCKEFISLSKYLEKYCGVTINICDIYQVCIGGKRGRIYGEDSSREYLAYKPNRCKYLLDELRKYRNSNDKVIVSQIQQVDDIDDLSLQYSIKYETEFDGIRRSQIEITIKTPKDKIKKNIVIS